MFEEIAAGIIGRGVIYTLLVVLGLIVIDTLLGVLKAFASKSFDVALLPDYLRTSVLPYIGSLVLLGIGALYVQPEIFGAIFVASALATMGKFGKEIYSKSTSMTGAKLTTECATCGEPMFYSMDSFIGEPICEKCRAEGDGDSE